MVKIEHIITDALGLHARPAAQLVKKAGSFECGIQVGSQAKMVDAKRILGVMSLALKHGETLFVTFEGKDEKTAAEEMKVFLKENL